MQMTASRRGNNEGTLRKRDVKNAAGEVLGTRWEARWFTSDGRQRSLYGKTRKEAAQKLAVALRDKEQGVPPVEGRQTVQQFLTGWLETMRPPTLVVETWERYAHDVRVNLCPEIGRVRLSLLTAQQVQMVYAKLSARGLSSTSVLHAHHVLHRALESALRLGLIQRNVTNMVERPRKRQTDIHPLSREQARAYLDAATGDRLAALFTLALSTGMRLGEMLALRWADVDLAATPAVVRVNSTLKWREGAFVMTTPKTKSSRRQIALTAHVADALRRHLRAQRVERLAAGPVWEGQQWGLVFCDEIGRPLMEGHVRLKHFRVCRAAGVPRIRVHDLRHTAATLLLGQRVNPKVVSEMLGHSSVGITLDIYSHVLPDMQQDAAAAMAVALGW